MTSLNLQSIVVKAILFATICAGSPQGLFAGWNITARNALELDLGTFTSIRELSGATYMGPGAAGTERFAAISDHDAQLATLDVGWSSNASLTSGVVVNTAILADMTFDFEGLAFTNPSRNSVFASYERDTENDTPNISGVSEYDLTTGGLLQSVSLGLPWTVDGDTLKNRGFESLARAQSGTTMWTANQEALKTDGEPSTPTLGTTVRLQRLDVAGNNVSAGPQFAYQVEPIHGPDENGAQSGVVDMLMLPDDTLLALERSVSSVTPNILHRIFQVDVAGATDISATPWNAGLIGETYQSVSKTLLFSGPVGGPQGSSLEGLALGPQLASGNWPVVGVVDGGATGGNLLVSFEFSPSVSCDFDADSHCNLADLNQLYAQGDLVAGQSVVPSNPFDLNGDMTLDGMDLGLWLEDSAAFNGFGSALLRGDTDGILPGSMRDVDITDFNRLASSFDPSGANGLANTWDKGNFDGDADIDITDFGFIAANFSPAGYGSSTMGAVPEPSFAVMCVGCLFGLILSLRLGRKRPVLG